MTSRRKRQSNRQNAKKSTGPRTARGKNHASKNALKHGAFALTVLPGENSEEFQTLLDGLWSQWNPIGIMEEYCVQEMACDLWRLKRLNRAEGGLLKDGVEDEAKERTQFEDEDGGMDSIDDETGNI